MIRHCKTAFLLAFFAFFVANAYIGEALPTRHDRFTVDQPDGSKVTVNLPDTGRSWSTITVELPFADGKQTIAIEGTNDISPMFNWFRIL